MNNFCAGLNLKNIHPLLVDVESYGTAPHALVPLTDINPILIEFLNLLDITVTLAETFYVKPFSHTTPHIDVQGGDYTKINFIYGGRDSKMNWYKVKDNTVEKPVKKTTINTDYLYFFHSEIEQVYEKHIASPSLVQVGIPHNITTSKESRRCISLVIKKLKDNSRITMSEAIKIFEPHLI